LIEYSRLEGGAAEKIGFATEPKRESIKERLASGANIQKKGTAVYRRRG